MKTSKRQAHYIQIVDNWFIGTDSLNIILLKHRVVKDAAKANDGTVLLRIGTHTITGAHIVLSGGAINSDIDLLEMGVLDFPQGYGVQIEDNTNGTVTYISSEEISDPEDPEEIQD